MDINFLLYADFELYQIIQLFHFLQIKPVEKETGRAGTYKSLKIAEQRGDHHVLKQSKKQLTDTLL